MTAFSTQSPYSIDVQGREALPGHTGSGSRTRRRGKGPEISAFCFVFAGLCALIGMIAGIVMGILQDFTIAPAHAHLNLLGWVTMALYGLYHRSAGRTTGWLGWTQALTGAAGAATIGVGLALYLHFGDHAFFPLVIVGSLLAVLGMVLFLGIVLADLMGYSRAIS
jgi:hypothetical protein